MFSFYSNQWKGSKISCIQGVVNNVPLLFCSIAMKLSSFPFKIIWLVWTSQRISLCSITSIILGLQSRMNKRCLGCQKHWWKTCASEMRHKPEKVSQAFTSINVREKFLLQSKTETQNNKTKLPRTSGRKCVIPFSLIPLTQYWLSGPSGPHNEEVGDRCSDRMKTWKPRPGAPSPGAEVWNANLDLLREKPFPFFFRFITTESNTLTYIITG